MCVMGLAPLLFRRANTQFARGYAFGPPSRTGPPLRTVGRKEKRPALLLAQAERCDERLVSSGILAVEVAEEAAALSDEHHEPALRVVILAVDSQMLGKLADALSEEGNLDVGGTDVCGVRPVGGRDFSCTFFCEHALGFSLSFLLRGQYSRVRRRGGIAAD
jgi:hypothetical protein